MKIINVSWTPKYNLLHIVCCEGKIFLHRSDRQYVRCPFCNLETDIWSLRKNINTDTILIDIARKPFDVFECQDREEIFAPSWQLLMDFKNSKIDWNVYSRRYIEEMRCKFKKNKEKFYFYAKELNQYIFICWCMLKKRQDQHCHRFLLQDLLRKCQNESYINC